MCDILLNHRNSRFLLLNHLRDDSLFAQWKGLQDLINVLVFQCKQLQQSADLVLGQVESCYDGLNVTRENPGLKEPCLDLITFSHLDFGLLSIRVHEHVTTHFTDIRKVVSPDPFTEDTVRPLMVYWRI